MTKLLRPTHKVRALQNARINEMLFACLAAQSAERPIVFLLDGYERAQPEERRWVEEELLRRVRDNHLTGVIVILMQALAPSFSEDWSRHHRPDKPAPALKEEAHSQVHRAAAMPLPILEAHKTFIQLVLDVDANNNPKMLANMVDQYMLKYPPAEEADADDSWLL